jgi:hypothetical protein
MYHWNKMQQKDNIKHKFLQLLRLGPCTYPRHSHALRRYVSFMFPVNLLLNI